MGNTIGASKGSTKIMNMKGETTKHKTPIQVMDITKHHDGHVLLDSSSVRAYGIRAKPLDSREFLEAKKVYFLVEQGNRREPRRVMSTGGMRSRVGAQERLEKLVMTRRSVSDLSGQGRDVVMIRLPKADVERLVRESKDHKEAADKILGLCMAKTDQVPLVPQKSPLGRVRDECTSKKRVGFFLPVNEGEIHQVAVAS